MKKKVWGIAAMTLVGVTAGVHFLTLPPPPPEVPPVPANIPVPVVPALTPYDLPTGQVPVSTEPYRSTNRSVAIEDLVTRNLATGVYTGTPYWKQREQWFKDHFYDTLAARKVWPEGKSPDTHKRGDPVTWGFEAKFKMPMNIMFLFISMEGAIGKDYEVGLERWKSYVEKPVTL